MKDHVTEEEFLFEFFGNFGRDLGDPLQRYTDNPQDIFPFIENCAREKKPAFYSVQPRSSHDVVYGIEKLFFEFDWAHESDEISPWELRVRKHELPLEVKQFAKMIVEDFPFKLKPLIMKSRRGYHVYVYFDMVYQISSKVDFWKVVYRNLQEQFLNHYVTKYKKPMKFCDSATFGDIKRLGRIPLSIHQKSGEKCILVDMNLKPDKLRSIAYYRLYGLKLRDLKMAANRASEYLAKKAEIMQEREETHREDWEMEHGFVGKIRLCFQVRMDGGEMCHQQRLALLQEAYWAGYRTPEKMIELFRCFKDFDGDNPAKSTCRYQVGRWFDLKGWLDSKGRPFHPWRCDTIQAFGWCIYEKCPIFRRRKKYAEFKKEEA